MKYMSKWVFLVIFILISLVSAQQVEVIIGTASTYSFSGPMNINYNYSTHEAIYLQSEIGIAGNIYNIAYYKHSGFWLSPIKRCTIYFKHTTDTILTTGTYSLTGYTRVFSGDIPVNIQTGWIETEINPFSYNNTDNLQILIIKGYQPNITGNILYWRYTTTSPIYRTRQAASDISQPTNLIQTYNRPNIKLTIFPTSSVAENNLGFNQLTTFLHSPQPNPVTNKTNISFNLSEAEKVALKIYDASGKLIKILVDEFMSGGVHNVIWNGTDEHNRQVAEGIYFYTLETPKQRFTKKLILTR